MAIPNQLKGHGPLPPPPPSTAIAPAGVAQALHAFRLNRDEKPVPLPSAFKYDWTYAMDMDRLQKDTPPPNGALFIPYGDATSCSNQDWKTLKPVVVDDLKCPHVHRGLAITVHVPHMASELGLDLGEDILGDIYPIGALLAISEPYVKYSADRVGVEICVDIPTDITRLHTRESLVIDIKWEVPLKRVEVEPTVEQLKTAGNEAFAEGDYLYAYERYSLALAAPTTERSPAMTLTLFLNRAILNIKRNCPGAAYRDCLAAEKLEIRLSTEQRQKLIWRKALAAYGLRMWSLAEQHCEEAVNLGVQVATGLLKDTRQRLLETKGVFNWRDLWTRMQSTGSVVMADYIGPMEIRHLPGRGRGLVLTEDVKAGQLLLVDQALVRTVNKGNRKMFELDMALDQAGLNASVSIYGKNKAIHELIDNPGRVKSWTGLTYMDGRKQPGSVNLPDPFLRPAPSIDDLLAPAHIDPYIISAISRKNSFGTEEGSESPMESFLRSQENPDGEQGSILYRLASLFNHSCCANVHQERWHESAVVRARVDMPKGTELLLTYLKDTFTSRTERLARSWGFTCNCELCIADAKDDHVKRSGIVGALNHDFALVSQGKQDFPTHQAIRIKAFDQLEKTYAFGRRLKPEAFDNAAVINSSPEFARKAYLYLGATLSTEASRKLHGRQLDSLGENDSRSVIRMLTTAMYLALPHPKEAASWVATACWVHDVLHGGGRWLFEQKFSMVIPKNLSWDYKFPVDDLPLVQHHEDDLD